MQTTTEIEKKYQPILKSAQQTILKRISLLENDKRRVDAPLSSQMDDQSQQVENDEVVNQLESLELNKLNQIIAALKRIETGNFGICNQCHDPISPARLDAFPSATTCIACTKEMSEIIL